MVAFVAAATAHADTAANAMTLTWPTVAAGDIAVITSAIGGLSAYTDPTGFTAGNNGDASVLRAKWWWRRCDGTETGTINVAWTGTAQVGACAMVVYRGILASGTPYNASSVSNDTATATSRTTLAGSALTRSQLPLYVYHDMQTSAAQSWTPSAGRAERVDVSSVTTTFVSCSIDEGAVLDPTSFPAVSATSAQSGLRAVMFGIGLILDPASEAAARTDLPATSDQVPLTALGKIDPIAIAGAGWPTSGQGWPRIKQG